MLAALLAIALPWTALKPGPEPASLPPAAAEAIARAAEGRVPRVVAGSVVFRGGAPPWPTRVVALPATPRVFAQHDELAKAPCAVAAIAPGWPLLQPAGALAVALPDPAGAFALTVDDRAWTVAACDDGGWCSDVAAIPAAGDAPVAPLRLRARRTRVAAIAVTDDQGAPLAGAEVEARALRLRWDPARTEPPRILAHGVTDASGRVLLAGLGVDAIEVEATAPGHAPGRAEIAGGALATVACPRPARVAVLVAADDEEPLEDVTAVLLRPTPQARAWQPDGEPVPAVAGLVTFASVRPGPLVVRASARGRLPNVSEALDVAPAGDVTARIELPRGLLVRGVVRDGSSKEGLADATISVEGRAGTTANSGDGGAFELGPLPPGDWTVLARHDDFAEELPARAEIRLGDEDADDVVLTLEPPGSVLVRVRDGNGPLEATRLRLSQERPSVTRDAVTDARGEAIFEKVPPRAATLHLPGRGGTITQFSAAGISEAAPRPAAEVAVRAGERTVVDVAIPGATVSGTIFVDDVPTPARVVIGSASNPPWHAGGPPPEPSTTYTLTGLPEGTTSLAVSVPAPAPGLGRRVATGSFLPATITIPPGVTRMRHDLRLESRAVDASSDELVPVEGVIVDDATQRPLPGWFVSVTGYGLEQADAAGAFRIELPWEGRFDVRPCPDASCADAAQPRTPLMMLDGRPGSGAPVIVPAFLGGAVTLRVLDRAGLPVAVTGELRLPPDWHGRETDLRLAADPTGRLVVRGPADVAGDVRLTDGASFLTCVGVPFGRETTRDVVVPETGGLEIRTTATSVSLRFPGCGGAVELGAWPRHLWEWTNGDGAATVRLSGVPAGEVAIVAANGRTAPARVAAGEVTAVDLR